MTYSDEGESRKIAILTLSVADGFDSGTWTATVVNSESGTRSDALSPEGNTTYEFKIRFFGDKVEVASTNGIKVSFDLMDLAAASGDQRLVEMFSPSVNTHTVTVNRLYRTYEDEESSDPTATGILVDPQAYTITKDLNGIYAYTVNTDGTIVSDVEGADNTYYFSYWFVYDEDHNEDIISYDYSVHNTIDDDVVLYAVYVRPETRVEAQQPISGIQKLTQTMNGTKKRLELITYYNVPTGTTVVSKGFILFKNDADYANNVSFNGESLVKDTNYEQAGDITVRSYGINNPALTYGTLTFGGNSTAGFNGYSVVSYIVIDNGDSTYSYVFSAPQVIPTV